MILSKMKHFLRSITFAALVSVSLPLLAATEPESQASAKTSYFVAPSSIDITKGSSRPAGGWKPGGFGRFGGCPSRCKTRGLTPIPLTPRRSPTITYLIIRKCSAPGSRHKIYPSRQFFHLKHVTADSSAVSSLTKHLYSSPASPAVDPTVHPCVEIPTSFSYPSGHSMRAFVWAAVLSEIYPDKREALFSRAHRAAWARIVGGVHYPSDDVGGRLLAAAIVAELMKNPKFHSAVEQARAEAEPFAMKKAA